MMKYIKELLKFFVHIHSSRELIIRLTINSFRKQYMGSYLGLFWAFLQPINYILVIWFVFELGLRVASLENGFPFSLWLICGLVPWFFISESFIKGSNAIVGNAFLVKKVAFKVSILPLVEIASACIIHLVLVAFLMLTFFLYGHRPTIYWMQLPFYISCSIFLLLGISWCTAALRVFIKDIASVITVLVQIGFWLTPIVWKIHLIPAKYQWIMKLNPAFYIVEGFRNTFIYDIWFWEKPFDTIYFLFVGSVVFALGALCFQRLRPHFGDVL